MNLIRKGLAAALLAAPMLAWAGAIEQLHQFLDGNRMLRAEFAQLVTGKTGKKAQSSAGSVAIARPGKLRWEIKKPYPQLVVSDGVKFWIYDPELAQVTVKKVGKTLGATPAALLAGSNDLERSFSLREAGEAEGLAWLEAVPKGSDSGFEKVRMGFASGELRAMELVDGFGQTTLLRFSKIEKNPALPPSLFKFTPPPGADVVGD